MREASRAVKVAAAQGQGVEALWREGEGGRINGAKRRGKWN
jgi:hypothetical protein